MMQQHLERPRLPLSASHLVGKHRRSLLTLCSSAGLGGTAAGLVPWTPPRPVAHATHARFAVLLLHVTGPLPSWRPDLLRQGNRQYRL